MEKTLIVKNIDGNEICINVTNMVDDTELNKTYICYTVENEDIVYISRLVQEGNAYSLETITEEEKVNVEEALDQEEGE